ncbi:MAG TPA: GH3 auxin-responsive promoter family protein [Actinocrinis sp.]|nr:GH3 auxin-responsive promoter family protein [Actinocrinis sp.]
MTLKNLSMEGQDEMINKVGGSVDFLHRTLTALAGQRTLCARPDGVQDQVLDDILGQQRGTEFGREHDLASVRSLADWQAAVPVRDYEDYRPYIDRILQGGQSVLTRSSPYAFLKTSGTSGRAKLVPTTRHWRENYRGPALYAQWGLYFQLLGIQRVEPWTALDLSWERTACSPEQNGFPVYSITQRWESFGGSDWTPPWYGTSWFDDSLGHLEDVDRLYGKARLLAGREVRLIVSVNPSKLVLFAEQIRDRAEEFIRDVRDGTLLGRRHPGLRPDPALARRLAAARAAHPLVLTDVWPSLSLLVCWMSASARLYEAWLRQLAPEVPILPFSTTGTEGIVTLPIDGHTAAGPLAVDQGIYEFFETDADGRMLGDPGGFADLSLGGTYRLVMSQANGLVRYDVGDLYRVTGWAGRVPRLEFTGRAGRNSSFTGEKLTESDFYEAVARATGDAGTVVPMFTGIPVWDTPPRYVVALEQQTPDEGLGERIEAILQQVNIEYADKRRSWRLGALSVIALPPGAFHQVARHRMRSGVASAQLKHHWLQPDAALLDVLAELDLVKAPEAVRP